MAKTRQRADLARENRELKRENSRLKKKVSQLEGSIDSLTVGEPEEEEAPLKPVEQNGPPIVPCPKCGGATERIELGNYTYKICPSAQCKHRERIGRYKD